MRANWRSASAWQQCRAVDLPQRTWPWCTWATATSRSAIGYCTAASASVVSAENGKPNENW